MTPDDVKKQSGKTLVLTTLLCHAHVPMALDCLGSWSRLCANPVEFVIHDDGTLTDEDKGSLGEKLSIRRLFSKQERDEHTYTVLGKYPESVKLRETYIHLAKAFDCVSLCEEDNYLFADTDILFWRRFANPFQALGEDVEGIFMRDRQHCYSMRSWQKAIFPEAKLNARQNSGLIGVVREKFDFDYLEWYLSKHIRRGSIVPVLEQTFFALLGGRLKSRIIDETQFRVMRANEDPPEIGGHFTARSRPILSEFVKRSEAADPDESPIAVRLEEPGVCTAGDLFSFEIQRIKNRLLSSRS